MSKISELEIDHTPALPTPTTDNWSTVPDSSTGQLIVGGMLKFKDGHWFIDKAHVAADDQTFAVIDARAAWVKFDPDGRPEQRITQPGKPHPELDEMPDRDESLWQPGLNGEPEDPWKDTRYVLLLNTTTAAELTFVTDTIGGRRAVTDLKRQVQNMRAAHPGAIPIVKLSSTMMKTKFGGKPRPVLEVVGWKGGHADRPQQVTVPTPTADIAIEPPKQYAADRIETAPQRSSMRSDDMDDEIPFSAEFR